MTGIVDAHHHIWRKADLPWLTGPMQPRIFGPYEPIRRDYRVEEYLADISGSGVVQSVYVQANRAPAAFENEVRWVEEVADESGWPHAIVGYADMLAEDVRPQFARLARYPRMRGIRMQLHWHENPQYRFASRADICDDARLARNIARLADYGWCFELQVFTGQMESAARLVRACPEITFVLQHAGMPEDISETGWTAWGDGLDRLAAEPNVVTKLSAFGTFVHRNDPDLIARVYAEAIRRFGASRAMFGSNFPIEKLWTGYAELIAAHRAAIMHLPAAEQRAILAGTARRVYRLPEPEAQGGQP